MSERFDLIYQEQELFWDDMEKGVKRESLYYGGQLISFAPYRLADSFQLKFPDSLFETRMNINHSYVFLMVS